MNPNEKKQRRRSVRNLRRSACFVPPSVEFGSAWIGENQETNINNLVKSFEDLQCEDEVEDRSCQKIRSVDTVDKDLFNCVGDEACDGFTMVKPLGGQASVNSISVHDKITMCSMGQKAVSLVETTSDTPQTSPSVFSIFNNNNSNSPENMQHHREDNGVQKTVDNQVPLSDGEDSEGGESFLFCPIISPPAEFKDDLTQFEDRFNVNDVTVHTIIYDDINDGLSTSCVEKNIRLSSLNNSEISDESNESGLGCETTNQGTLFYFQDMVNTVNLDPNRYEPDAQEGENSVRQIEFTSVNNTDDRNNEHAGCESGVDADRDKICCQPTKDFSVDHESPSRNDSSLSQNSLTDSMSPEFNDFSYYTNSAQSTPSINPMNQALTSFLDSSVIFNMSFSPMGERVDTPTSITPHSVNTQLQACQNTSQDVQLQESISRIISTLDDHVILSDPDISQMLYDIGKEITHDSRDLSDLHNAESQDSNSTSLINEINQTFTLSSTTATNGHHNNMAQNAPDINVNGSGAASSCTDYDICQIAINENIGDIDTIMTAGFDFKRPESNKRRVSRLFHFEQSARLSHSESNVSPLKNSDVIQNKPTEECTMEHNRVYNIPTENDCADINLCDDIEQITETSFTGTTYIANSNADINVCNDIEQNTETSFTETTDIANRNADINICDDIEQNTETSFTETTDIANSNSNADVNVCNDIEQNTETSFTETTDIANSNSNADVNVCNDIEQNTETSFTETTDIANSNSNADVNVCNDIEQNAETSFTRTAFIANSNENESVSTSLNKTTDTDILCNKLGDLSVSMSHSPQHSTLSDCSNLIEHQTQVKAKKTRRRSDKLTRLLEESQHILSQSFAKEVDSDINDKENNISDEQESVVANMHHSDIQPRSLRVRKSRKSWDFRRDSRSSQKEPSVLKNSEISNNCDVLVEGECAVFTPVEFEDLQTVYGKPTYDAKSPRLLETIKENASEKAAFSKKSIKRFLQFGVLTDAKRRKRVKKALNVYQGRQCYFPIMEQEFERKMLDVQLLLDTEI